MLNVYNTLSRKKEEFKELKKGVVTMYSCGPTVYSYAHIGNMRSYIFMDMLRRVLKYDGYKVKGVMNITDVGHLLSDADEGEDKMQKASREQHKTPYEIADFYSKFFFDDIAKLNIGKPEVTPKATDHIQEMIAYVQKLIELGYAYEIDDGIYFDVSKFKGYGKLSRLNLDEQIAGARVEVNSQKHNPYDFAVWKKAEPNHIMQWQSPWGQGYPGWHIECSVMSQKYLGEVFDIHTGGVDHIPVHHENEIAQNEAVVGKKTVDYWMHGEFMLVDNGKMSKSLGNTYTLKQLEERGYCAMDFRYFCLNAHYRKKLNFTFEGMDSAKISYERLLNLLYANKISDVKTEQSTIDAYKNEFIEAINDDINIPLALGVLWKALREPKSKDIYLLALDMDRVLGLSLDNAHPQQEDKQQAPAQIIELAEQRLKAKADKNYALSDKLRGDILAQGYQIKDTKEGYELSKN
ncbi:MAG: cysteine--tRNA ligase [Clostridia bacterium]